MDSAETRTKPIILAVDDRPELLQSIIHMLGGKYTVIAVTSAVTAIKVISSRSPDLFLLDIEMPDLNGYEFAALIRKHEDFKQKPIIFLTSMGDRDYVFEAMRNGGNDFIVKPVEKEVLLSKIERYLG